MPRMCLLGLTFFCTLASAAAPHDETAYSIGVQLGERLRGEVAADGLDDLVQGLRQGYAAGPTALPRERIRSLLEAHASALEKQNSATPEQQAAMRSERLFLVNEKARFGVRELAGGVLVSELRAGRSPANPNAREVQVNYRGLLTNGSQFDASSSPQWFRLDSVIPGWRVALAQMPVGARWRVVIPSVQAYGANGAGNLIPPYSALIFEIDLLQTR
ncbi:MAG: Peptidyl-prolyl cis-trans isomerase Mip [Stenotrophomonas maltophilia]|nr:MAG: Peptidyl-prolyl cis-trans isomerase Mip [Stenotrophomonas maltophilia]